VFMAGALGLDVVQSGKENESPEEALSAAIGIALPGGRFKVLIEANTPLPTRVIRRNPTTKDRQSEFELELYQGGSAAVMDCRHLGTICLPDLPKSGRGEVFVDLEISVQKDGVTRVVLCEPQTNRKVSSVVWTEQTPEKRREEIKAQAQADLTESDKQKGKKGLLGRFFGR
jgi:molecular chaperone DnaK